MIVAIVDIGSNTIRMNAYSIKGSGHSELIVSRKIMAGIAQRPEDYEWCSFAAAGKGDEKARRGYAFMYGNADDWDVIRDCHEKSMREAMSEILASREAERAEREAKGGACA